MGGIHGSFVSVVPEGISRHGKIPDVGVCALRQFRSAVFGIFQHELHVGLSPGEPDLTECHIREGLFVHRHGTARSAGHGRQCHAPAAVCTYSAGNSTAALRDGNRHRLAGRSRAENRNGLSTLEQHMVCKNGCTLYHNGFSSYCDGFIGNTAQSLCVRCAARFFGRLRRNFAGILSYVKRFLCNMTENQQADCVQSRQAGFVRYCLYYTGFSGGCQRNGRVSNRRS